MSKQPGRMQTTMPQSTPKPGKMPQGNPREQGSDSPATGYKSGGAVKRMPTTMKRKSAAGC